MVVCKFFLQGTCRFGNSCKFEHQINTDHSYAGSSSILVQNYANKPAQGATNVDTNTLIKAVVNDMMSAEKGGQWLLSSYAPFRDKPPFPGFEDHSMEEVRYLFYESMKNGTIEQYKQNLQMMLQQAMIKIKALQNPSPDAVNLLKTIYNTPSSNSVTQPQTSGIFGQQKSTFGGTPPNNSIFGGGANQGQQNIFGGGATNTSVFGSTSSSGSSIFGGAQQKSVFGGTQQTSTSIFGQQGAQQSSFGSQPPQNQNPFGQTHQQNQSPFGQVGQNQSPFGQSQAQAQSQTIFGQTNQSQTQNSPFGQSGQAQNQNIFGQTNQPQGQNTPFGQSNQAQGQNIFGQNQAQISPFGQTNQPQSQNSLFGQTTQAPPQNSPFGQTNPQNIFGQQSSFGVTQQAAVPTTVANKPAFQHTQSIFGTYQQPSNNLFGAEQTKPNEDFYSKIEDLTEEEIKWFQSDDLDVSKIPEKPPTYEMCFKVQ